MIPGILRWCAIGIALAAVVDPSITSMRTAKPEIALVTSGPENAQLADRLERALVRRFTIVRSPFSEAAGTVVVGDHLPLALDELASPVFAVLPDPETPTVTLEAARAPERAHLDARAPITASARVRAARGQTLEVALRLGDVIVDRTVKLLSSDDEGVEVPLSFIPSTTGVIAVRVAAGIVGAQPSAATDLLIDVRDDRSSVLFFDPRPSWQSTFVRRTLERDPRFVVTSRVVLAPDVTSDAGKPPASLGDLLANEEFEAIVVGAPEALTERDVAGLETYLRRRAGSVLLLLDQRAAGAYDRLASVARWGTTSGTSVRINSLDLDDGGLRAAELAWPNPLPQGAVPLALDSAGRPIVWRTAVGAGRLVVSGALDAWRFRDPAVSGFDRFWRTLMAELADAATAPIALNLSSSIVEPGEETDLTVTLRDVALADAPASVTATVSAVIESDTTTKTVRLWPSDIGELRGAFRAPSAPGTYRIVVTSDGRQASVPLVVARGVSRLAPSGRDVVDAWVASRGGATLTAARIDDLPAAITRSLRPTSRRETWHPMRSPWWIVPFALALGAEWWSRRRRGLA